MLGRSFLEEKWKTKTFLDYKLNNLTTETRAVFIFVVLLMLIFAIFGNCATLFVNSKRKFRPLFHACLLSLACSDLITAIFTAVVYLSQFSSDFPQIWHLGVMMCGLTPFLQTTAILANSLTLVGIALDRYLAVIKAIKRNWEPGSIFCGTCVTIIWGLSAGIASPMISSYTTMDVNIILTDPKNSTKAQGVLHVKMCFSEKNNNAFYYLIVFTIVFLPSVIMFLMLNGAICYEIYARRFFNQHLPSGTAAGPQKDDSKNRSTTSVATVQASCKEEETGREFVILPRKKVRRQRTHREYLQFRMMVVIGLLMGIFLVCRLPTWIFLIMKLHKNYNEITHWVLHFSFGSLSLFSCVLNPFLYSFLTGTIQHALALRNRLCKKLHWCWGGCCGRDNSTPESESRNPDGKSHPPGSSNNGEIYTISRDK